MTFNCRFLKLGHVISHQTIFSMNAPSKAPLLLGNDSVVNKENFPQAIQQAIEIEIATIPVYLYTYYSINRNPNQDELIEQLTADLLAAGKTKEEASTLAQELSADIMVYANRAGALIMSVVIEEMLHMALSSNIKQATVGQPELLYKTPTSWPAYLPGHIPEFPINRSKLSFRSLYTFLQIESPDKLKEPGTEMLLAAKPIEYTTIGEFYSQIEKYLGSADVEYHPERPQLIPGKGYYTNNTIDTIYYNREHKPVFTNAEDSGDLIYVTDAESAIAAMQEIVEQGEGHTPEPGSGLTTGLNANGTVNCAPGNIDDTDNPSGDEESHFFKFNQVYCDLHKYLHKFAHAMGKEVCDVGDQDASAKTYFDPAKLDEINDEFFTKYFVLNVPENPSVADYTSPAVQKVATLTNAIYTYIFLMSEDCYRRKGHTQYELFMFGIHKSMIFILNSLCGELTGMSYVAKDGKTYNAAPTFEDYHFATSSSPKSQLIELFNSAVGAYDGIAYLGQRIHDLPDVPLEPYLDKEKGKLSFAG